MAKEAGEMAKIDEIKARWATVDATWVAINQGADGDPPIWEVWAVDPGDHEDTDDLVGEIEPAYREMVASAPADIKALLAEVERLTKALAETEAARVEAFEMARKFIVDDSPPTEAAMRYGREVVAPMATASFAAANGAPAIEACTVRAPDCLSGVYRCFVMGSGAAVGKGDTEALAYADFVTKWVAAKSEVKP